MEKLKQERTWINGIVGFVFVSCLMSFLLVGCALQPRQPSLSEMSRWQVRDFSSDQLKTFLDSAYADKKNRRDYWIPMMDNLVGDWTEFSSDELWIPMGHLKKAINNYNQTAQYEKQEDAIFIYYWQIYNNVDVRKELYGFPQDWGKGDEGPARIYLRKYLPVLFSRYQDNIGGNFDKFYKLVNQYDSELIKDLFLSKNI